MGTRRENMSSAPAVFKKKKKREWYQSRRHNVQWHSRQFAHSLAHMAHDGHQPASYVLKMPLSCLKHWLPVIPSNDTSTTSTRVKDLISTRTNFKVGRDLLDHGSAGYGREGVRGGYRLVVDHVVVLEQRLELTCEVVQVDELPLDGWSDQ